MGGCGGSFKINIDLLRSEPLVLRVDQAENILRGGAFIPGIVIIVILFDHYHGHCPPLLNMLLAI